MKKRILSVLLALVMALSLCTVAMAEPDADAAGAGTPSVTTISLEGFYYGNTVDAISVSIAGNLNIRLLESKLMVTDDDGYTSEAPDWIGLFNNYYLQVTLVPSTDAPSDYVLPADSSDYDLFVRQYDNNLRPLDPDLNLARPAPNSIISIEATNTSPASVTLTFPLTLTVINYNVTIPLTKTVNQAGNVAPGATTFQLDILAANDTDDDQDPADLVTVSTTFTVGDNSITISGPKAMVDAFLDDGFFVREKTHSDRRWTCDTTMWFVEDNHVWGVDGNGSIACTKVTTWGVEPECVYENNRVTHQTHFDGVTFDNTYTENRSTTHRNPTPTPTEKIEAPKTFDAGIAVYGVSALLSLTGSAWVVTRRRDR